jgi:hypothetical protein
VSCGVLGLKPNAPQGAEENTKDATPQVRTGVIGSNQAPVATNQSLSITFVHPAVTRICIRRFTCNRRYSCPLPFVAGESAWPSAPSRAPGFGVHWSEAETLDGGSGRTRRRIWPGRKWWREAAAAPSETGRGTFFLRREYEQEFCAAGGCARCASPVSPSKYAGMCVGVVRCVATH